MLHVFLEYDVGEFGVTSRQHQLRSKGLLDALSLPFSRSRRNKRDLRTCNGKVFLLRSLAQEIKLLVYDLWEIKE